jgi:hypothetical protein
MASGRNTRTFVVLPRVRVRPVDELLKHPSEEPDGRVSECIPKRLGPRALDHKVSRAVVAHRRGARRALALDRARARPPCPQEGERRREEARGDTPF